MTGYEFHPEARFDLAEVREFIRTDNLDAAGFACWAGTGSQQEASPPPLSSDNLAAAHEMIRLDILSAI